MPIYAPTLFSLSFAALLVLLSSALFVRFSPSTGAGGGQAQSEQAIQLSLGIIAVLLLVINLNLWLPGQWIYPAAMAAALGGAVKLWMGRRSGGARVLAWIVCILLLALLTGCITAYRVDAAHYWLVETSNHDTLFYFEGAHWAIHNPIYVDPSKVNEALNLGGCRMGAVFIGNDCAVYRGGSFSLLGLALGFGGGTAGNDMLIGASLGVLLLAAGLLPLIVQQQGVSRFARLGWIPFCCFIVLVIYFSPTLLAAAINSNVATTFGAVAAGMVLGLSLHTDRIWWRRPLMFGLGAALAAHTYGESAASAVLFAAMGVFLSSLRDRSVSRFMLSACVCAGAFFIAANVIMVELIQSARDVEAIASGGQWEGFYLNAKPLTWLAAPFAGMVINGNPYVSHAMLAFGWVISTVVVICSLTNFRTACAMISIAIVFGLLVSFVEARDYLYGEHKIIQMVGTSAVVLAAGIVIRFLGAGVKPWSVRIAGCMLLLLLLGAIVAQARPSLEVSVAWRAPHGLSLDFRRDLDVAMAATDWVIDDTGASGMERFQKTHYLAYLIHENGGRAYLPKLDSDGMRGGYARRVLGGTLVGIPAPRWLVQLKSYDGIRSPFQYVQAAVTESTEYDLIDLSRASPGLAVSSGENWRPCVSSGCPVASGFEIEAITWAGAAQQCSLTVLMDGTSPVSSKLVKVTVEGGDTHVAELVPEGVRVHLASGWQRVRFEDPAAQEGEPWMVHSASVSCDAE